VRADWPLVLAGVVVSLLVVPALLSLHLAARPPTAAGTPLLVGLVAMLPGVLMGGIGLWVAARG
jgi:hypothetical protein